MFSMKKVFLILPFLIFSSLFGYSQIDYQVRIDELFSAADDSDGSGNEDPVWKVYLIDDDAGPLQSAGCVTTTHAFNTWHVDAGLASGWFTRTGTIATLFASSMEAWEDDDCGTTCVYDDNCFLNDDDSHAPVGTGDGSTGNTGDISIINNPPCTWTQSEIFITGDNNNGSPSTYRARISIFWEPNGGIDAGSISGDQVVCLNGDPAAFTSIGGGEPVNFPTYYTYQWQEDAGCNGTWADIGGAVSATYDAPIGITQSTCFRRLIKSTNCLDVISNPITVTVIAASTAASSINSSQTVVCNSGTIDLNVFGGSLAVGDAWEWYEGDPNGTGTPIGTNSPLSSYVINSTTTFYVRAEGPCGNTATASLLVTVSPASTVDPTNVTTASLVVCVGAPIDLTVIAAGTLGSGAVWAWYNTDPSIGTPSPIYVNASPIYNISPVVSTTYYVRGEGCDTSVVAQTTITITDPSIPPSGIDATQTSFCAGGGASTLSIPDGTLGAGATWEWYADGCGAGIPIGSGTSIIVSPTVTTTYYVRAEGGCNGNTACVNIEISIDAASADPASIASPNTDLCLGETTVLSVSGGTLGTGATWEWFQGSCGGISVGQGTSISVLPSVTTIYYVRAEGACGNTICVDITVTVGVGAANPTSAAVSVNNICPGDTTQLSVTGPVLNPGYTWVWYTGACGAVPAGVGTTLDVFPTITTTYYVRAVGTCGQTNCVSVTVDVLDAAIMANGITADNNYFCTGDSAVLELYGGTLVTGAGWVWYENSCGGTPIGTGTIITVSPATNTAYFVRAEGGTCGNTACVNISINVLNAYAYMTPFDTLCGMGYPFDLANGVPEGGVYSGTGITNGIFDPILAGLGTHAVTYTFTEDNGCIAIATGEIVIDSNDIVASVSIVPETCAEGGITLVGSAYGGSGFYIYEWSNGFIGNPLQYVDTGAYSVIVVDGSNCVSVISDIMVNEDVACIEMPNSFTPNNDGTNDMWNLDFSGYSNGSIQVYSKWGTLVWESSGTTLSWDGTSNGQVLPAGTYYYILDIDNGSLTQNGPVTIVK